MDTVLARKLNTEGIKSWINHEASVVALSPE
jgi:hypothetical protein